LFGFPSPIRTVPCDRGVLRSTKIATIEAREAEVIGRLNADQLQAVFAVIDLTLVRNDS
jgi:hypothetical protein